ncbi:MAG: heavy metal translocating P-type ATPase [Pseudomonadota bacterium]
MTALAACPGCAAAPAARALAGGGEAACDEARKILLSLPNVTCAGCIAGAEAALSAVPGVADARVNLSLKRATIRAAADVTPEALIDALGAAGHKAMRLDEASLAEGADDPEGRALLIALGVSGFAMMNVMLLSVSVWSGAEAATRDFLHWVSAAIALPVVAFAARPFFRNALAALSAGRLNMDVPISLAIVLAALMSLYETWMSGRHAYFDAALSLTFFLLLGRYLDHRTRASARSAARELTALEAPTAMRLGTGGAAEEVAVAALAVGDLIRLAPGMRAPVDGVVETGVTDFDRSPLTGESAPVAARPGDPISAGEMNLTGAVELRVTAVGEDSSLRRMADLVAAAERGRGRYASLADRAARLYAPGVHLLALVAFIGWMAAAGDARFAMNVAVAVLIITCPCALGLAAPAVATSAAGRLFRRGVLLKSGTALERLAEVDLVVFDKTGTVTTGAPLLMGGAGRDELALAAGLAAGSAHPYARALARAAETAGVAPAAVAELREVPGAGVEGRFKGRAVRLGRAEWLGAEDGEGGATWLDDGRAAPRRFAFEDEYREGAAALVAALKADGIETRLLSGDGDAAVARAVAALGFDEGVARADPEAKLKLVEALAAEGRRVLMIGDGLNDTGALAAAHVSVAPGSALDAARVASDIVVLNGDLSTLAGAFATARSARRRILENFGIAGAYNLVAVPIALAGFATPLIAALAMSASSITVSLNAVRLR